MKFNWFGDSFTIPMPWWLSVLIVSCFVFIVCAIAGKILAKNTYACPNCGHRFKKKWYNLMLSAHINDDRLLKCPECKEKDYCTKTESF